MAHAAIQQLHHITITALPTATIAYTGSPYCASGIATVTQTGTAGGTYTSTAGLTINAATGDIDLVASTPGTYTVTYSFTSGGCSNTTTATITIKHYRLRRSLTPVSPYCATGIATVTQTGTAGGTYSSTAGLTINAATGDVDLVASTPGTYTVTYSFTSGTCSNTATASITINALPTATINYAGSPYCATGTATVTQTGTAGGTYTSTAGLTINAATGDINLAASTPGTYTVTYSFTSGGCSNTATTSITINPLPVAAIAYTGGPYCATGTATPTQTGVSGGFYTAPAGVSINGVTGVINLLTSTPGIYTVTYTFSNGTCLNTATAPVTINALPSAIISYAGSPYCATGIAIPTQTGQSGGTYSATAGLLINASTGVINLAGSTAGTHTVTYTFSNGTCTNSTTANVTINALPVATIAYTGTPYCTNGTAIVSLTGIGGGTFVSSAGLSLNAVTGDINLAASSEGTYTVFYSFTNGTCSNTTLTTLLLRIRHWL